MTRPLLIKDPHTAAFVGVLLWGAGLFVIYDAYSGRGRRTPFFLRAFTPVG